MSTQLALPNAEPAPGGRFRLPPAVPPFNRLTYRLFSLVWLAAFLLALGGPIAGFYLRYTSPSNNSQLLLGSRAGFAVSPRDATLVRFPVGPDAQKTGVKRGDHIVAVYGLPLPRVMPMDEETIAEHQEDPAYIAMGNLLFGTDSSEVPLTVRDANGQVRDVTVTTGEQHIDAGAKALGIAPQLLSFIDLLPVLAYPFLLWAAWLLHRRNSRDVVSSLLSLAVLLTIAAEQPSSVFLASVGVPRGLNVAMYDLGNVLLLAGILLFPHGNLSWRMVGLLACLPVLMLLQGQAYQWFFVAFMIFAVLLLLRSLRKTPSSDMRQQIRWALLGFSGYALFHGISIASDFFKWSTDSFGHQLLVELLAGVTFALGVLVLQLGLLIALLRYRLYDAEVVISRSVNVALITLGVAAVFAGTADALKQLVYNYYGNSNSEGPVIFAAALATILVNPIQGRITRWSENRFQRNLVILRDELPECVRDLRETADLGELIDEILARILHGVQTTHVAAIIDQGVFRARGIDREKVEEWKDQTPNWDSRDEILQPSDRLFPVRIPLTPGDEAEGPIGYVLVGPRPDGSVISHDEQKALKGVSEPIGRAIRTVIKRVSHERRIESLIEAQSHRIDELEARLTGPSVSTRPTSRSA